MNPFSSEFSPQRISLKAVPAMSHGYGIGAPYPPTSVATSTGWMSAAFPSAHMASMSGLGHVVAHKHLLLANNREPSPPELGRGDEELDGECFSNTSSGQTVELVAGTRNVAPCLVPLGPF